MAKTAVLEKLTKSMTWLWQEFPWLSSDCQGALVSTASTNASICILRARFTQTQFPDDSAYDSLSCPLQDSTILTESRQNFHSSVLVISISALARTMASSSLGTTPGTKKNLRFWHKKNRGPLPATENRQKHRLCGSASWFLLSSLHPAFAIQPGDGNTHLMRFSQHLLATSHKLQGSFNLSNPTEKKNTPKKKTDLEKAHVHKLVTKYLNSGFLNWIPPWHILALSTLSKQKQGLNVLQKSHPTPLISTSSSTCVSTWMMVEVPTHWCGAATRHNMMHNKTRVAYCKVNISLKSLTTPTRKSGATSASTIYYYYTSQPPNVAPEKK